jgi:hypothetical protein
MKTNLNLAFLGAFILFMSFQSMSQSYVTSSPDSVCAGAQNVVYRIPPPANQASIYNWSITGAGVMTVFQAPVNDSIYVNWPNTVGVDFVRVFQSVGAGCQGPEAELEVHRYLPTATISGGATICQGSDAPGSFTITFTGRAPFNATFQLSSGANTLGPFTVTNHNQSTFTVNIPAVANAGNYTATITSASDRSCNITTPTGNPVLNVITAPLAPLIQHID